jgi:hypothetical protein
LRVSWLAVLAVAVRSPLARLVRAYPFISKVRYRPSVSWPRIRLNPYSVARDTLILCFPYGIRGCLASGYSFSHCSRPIQFPFESCGGIGAFGIVGIEKSGFRTVRISNIPRICYDLHYWSQKQEPSLTYTVSSTN